MKEGELAYRRINRLAMRLLKQDGLLISASCSYHMSRNKLLDNIRRAALKLEQEVQVLEQGHQGPDHPVHAAMPETDYLKAYFCRLLDNH
jgi:23S rRNA (cytosine1962-C5)-methyltransferase